MCWNAGLYAGSRLLVKGVILVDLLWCLRLNILMVPVTDDIDIMSGWWNEDCK